MPVSVFKQFSSGGRITMSEVCGVQLTRQLPMATRIEAAEHSATTVLKDLVQAEIARQIRLGMFSFGAGKH